MCRILRVTLTVLVMLVAGSTVVDAQVPNTDGPAAQVTNSIGMKLTLIPAGEFLMGSGESPEETLSFFEKKYQLTLVGPREFQNEHPQHQVRITKPFYLGTFHVTRGQFREFVEATGYQTHAESGPFPDKPGVFGMNPETGAYEFNKGLSWRNAGFEQTDEHPAVHINWGDAIAFCKWLSKKEGQVYRLPTEAEWEYACRAGTVTRYYCGDDPEGLAGVANVADQMLKAKFERHRTIGASDGYVFTAPVGQFEPNAFGLYDMLGNARQWCSDWYDQDYYTKSPVDDPAGPSDNDAKRGSIDHRVLRGCCWHTVPARTCATARGWQRPDDSHSDYSGFRIARDR